MLQSVQLDAFGHDVRQAERGDAARKHLAAFVAGKFVEVEWTKKDKYGRDILDPKFGVQIRFQEFGDSSVDLSVVQFVSVEEKFAYASRAKEAVYNALNANNIEIPFPQRDVHLLRQLP